MWVILVQLSHKGFACFLDHHLLNRPANQTGPNSLLLYATAFLICFAALFPPPFVVFSLRTLYLLILSELFV